MRQLNVSQMSEGRPEMSTRKHEDWKTNSRASTSGLEHLSMISPSSVPPHRNCKPV
jgi:hypothetical protein